MNRKLHPRLVVLACCLPHHVYVLCCSDDTLYTGYTTDVQRRLEQHQDGQAAKYTRGRTPVELVHVETYGSRSAAMKREAQIKAMRREDKLALLDPETVPVAEQGPSPS